MAVVWRSAWLGVSVPKSDITRSLDPRPRQVKSVFDSFEEDEEIHYQGLHLSTSRRNRVGGAYSASLLCVSPISFPTLPLIWMILRTKDVIISCPIFLEPALHQDQRPGVSLSS